MRSKPSQRKAAIDTVTAFRHPAFLFSAGNTALAIGQAETIALILNFALTAILYAARFVEVRRGVSLGIPFSILVAVNVATALSIELNIAFNLQGGYLHFASLSQHAVGAHVSAFAYIAWAIGHFFAGRDEKSNLVATRPVENPQTYYGVGDMAAVNASGAVNPFSFPLMVVGFFVSLRIGRPTRTSNHWIIRATQHLTAARLYAAGYLIGAATSLRYPHLLVAQLFWALAYLQFAKDT